MRFGGGGGGRQGRHRTYYIQRQKHSTVVLFSLLKIDENNTNYSMHTIQQHILKQL